MRARHKLIQQYAGNRSMNFWIYWSSMILDIIVLHSQETVFIE